MIQFVKLELSFLTILFFFNFDTMTEESEG